MSVIGCTKCGNKTSAVIRVPGTSRCYCIRCFDAYELLTKKVQLDPIVPSKENGPESEALSR
jgi:hypothetical protein